jgi:peptidoglycan/xylan/chitin deacetylase (PgdA/CDA1 family)
MFTQDIEPPGPLDQQRQQAGTKHSTVAIILSVIFILFASLTPGVIPTRMSEKAHGSQARSPATPWVTPSPPIRFSLLPTPTLKPFPATLQEQIAYLQAQDHFLSQGNPHLPEIALTFDDGPDPFYTPQILAILEHYKIKATFFCIGWKVENYPDLVRQEQKAGNVVGNHTWSHPYLSRLSDPEIVSQLTSTSDAIYKVIGVRPTFFRPPFGDFNGAVLTRVYHLGMITVLWNDSPADWLRQGVDVILNRTLTRAGDGAIILLHDGGGDRSQTVAALPFIIEGLQQRGFQLVTLQQLVDDMPGKHALPRHSQFIV